jgi:hypothetical protein
MFVPMLGFFLMLILFGGIGSLVVTVDTHAAHKAPVPFAMLFAGLGVYAIFFLALFFEIYISVAVGGFIGLLIAPLVGGVGGGIVGYRLGLRRSRRYSQVASHNG